jgi:EAL domain-containing protein (putative c-di-GMP-specific phosphodiesterase class I)
MATEFEGFRLHSVFQPIYGVRCGRAVGYEALVRAIGPDGRAHEPRGLFSGLGPARTVSLDWLCRSQHLGNFPAHEAGDRRLHLNVHPLAALEDAGLARQGRSPMQLSGLTADRICLEIPESSVAAVEELAQAVAAYRNAGFSIAIDDFGVKRSSLERVERLRPDYVKLDRALLAVALGDERLRSVLPGLVATLQAAGARVVVKGIESTYEAYQALDAGADCLQGNAFAAPQEQLHDDALTERLLAELLRLRRRQPASSPRRATGP